MRPAPFPSRALAVALVGLLALSAFAFLSAPARGGIAVLFREDFESGAIGSRWNATDNNTASGLDYWGVSNDRAHTGNYSAWCAEIGIQSDTGQNNTAVQQYDDDMQADLTINLGVSGFSSLTLSFYYWSKAESGGGDFLEAWYVAGGVPTMIFQNRGTSNWDLAFLAVPTNIEQLVVRFTSDASNHGFEGAYVDDVILTGTESNAPTSSVSPLPTYENSLVFNIPYTAFDGVNESGVAYVELWYRNATASNFTIYRGPTNRTQWFASPVRFDASFASGEGYYEFYTVAMDNAQNPEAPPLTADATTTVDATPPTIAITAPSVSGWLRTSTVNVTWQGADGLSGLDHYETSLDGGAATAVGMNTLQTFSGVPDGTRVAEVRAYDRAGNVATATVTLDIDVTPPELQITTPTLAQSFATSAVTATWDATDATSLIDHYEVWLDGGAPQTTNDPRFTFPNVADGQHTLHVVAVDKAGNTRSATVAFTVSTFPWWLVILAVIAFLVILFLVWRRRKETESPTVPPRPSDAPPVESATGAPPTPEEELMPTAGPPPVDPPPEAERPAPAVAAQTEATPAPAVETAPAPTERSAAPKRRPSSQSPKTRGRSRRADAPRARGTSR